MVNLFQYKTTNTQKNNTERLSPPQPTKYPDIVYKYRDWKNDYHKNVLINLELFLSSPSHFNDPFDCKIPIAYWKLAEDQKLAAEYFPQVVSRHFPYFTKQQQIHEVERLLKDGRFSDNDWLLSKELEFYKHIENDFGVISFSHYKDDIKMWSHYSNSHTGFCIGFKSEKLFFNSPENELRFGQGGMVEYATELPIILPTLPAFEQYTKVLYTKLEVWSDEKEYRLTKSGVTNKIVHFYHDEVAEIILGLSMSANDIKSVLNICTCNLPNIPIYKARPKHRDFKLEFDRIQ
jgi:hypothetical protein